MPRANKRQTRRQFRKRSTRRQSRKMSGGDPIIRFELAVLKKTEYRRYDPIEIPGTLNWESWKPLTNLKKLAMLLATNYGITFPTLPEGFTRRLNLTPNNDFKLKHISGKVTYDDKCHTIDIDTETENITFGFQRLNPVVILNSDLKDYFIEPVKS